MIDAHVHIGGEAVGFEMNETLVLQSMEKYGIDISIVSNGNAAEYEKPGVRLPEAFQVDQEASLERIIDFCRANRYNLFDIGKYNPRPNPLTGPPSPNMIHQRGRPSCCKPSWFMDSRYLP